MRTKLIALVTLIALLITAAGAALAAPGSAADPFITLNYLTDVFLPQAEKDIEKYAQKAFTNAGKDAFDRLDSLAGNYLAQSGGGSLADTFLPVTLYRGDRLDVPAGSSLMYQSGIVELTLSSGALLDVTDGSVLTGGALKSAHRYVAAENTACSITAVSDAAYVSVRGNYYLGATGMIHSPFTDIQESDWFYPYVRYAWEESLFNGMTPTTFGPNTNMSRAMLVTVLRRIAGMEHVSIPSMGFSDVPNDTWYADAVNWAAAANIVDTGSSFRPNANATREELADMLYRFAKYFMGADMPAGDLSGYTDASKVSSFAQASMSWAVGQGVINGMTPTTLEPRSTVTRAQVATMLQRFLNLY